MKRVLFLFALLALSLPAPAQHTIDVSKQGQGKLSINLSGVRTGSDGASRIFLSVLKADLNRSGYFTVTSSGGILNVAGSAMMNGAQLRAECQVFESSTRRRVFGRAYQGDARSARSLAHKVADEIILAVTGKPGMSSAKVALVGNRTGRKELWVCDIDGQNLQQVTGDRSIVVGPKWAPDGKRLVYTSYKLGYPNVYITGRGKPVSSQGGLNTGGAISPDGSQMALILSKDGNPELYLKSMRTGRLTRMTNTRQGNEASPTWSPDGRSIAFVSDVTGRPQVYIIPSSGGQARRITSSGSENVAPDWGPNNKIACSTRMGGRYVISIIDPANRSIRQVQHADWADYEDPSWAPDGRHIVCSRTASHRSGIYLLDTEKDSHVALLEGSGDWFSPACSP